MNQSEEHRKAVIEYWWEKAEDSVLSTKGSLMLVHILLLLTGFIMSCTMQ